MAYRVIDKETMPRREQFDYFRAMAQPYVGITWELDITDLRRRQKAEGWPFFLTMLYLAGQAANRVPPAAPAHSGGGRGGVRLAATPPTPWPRRTATSATAGYGAGSPSGSFCPWPAPPTRRPRSGRR